MFEWLDDKTQVIIAVFVIGLAVIFYWGIEAKDVLTAIISGLFGVAVGKALNGANGQEPQPPKEEKK